MIKRYHILLSGTVQGVGFRYTARLSARANSIVGWVRNLSDGRVEMEAQGTSENIEFFLKALHNEFQGGIRDVAKDEVAILAEEDFRIKA